VSVKTAFGSAVGAVGTSLASGSVPIWTSAGFFEGPRCSARVKRAVVSPCGAPREALRGVGARPGLTNSTVRRILWLEV